MKYVRDNCILLDTLDWSEKCILFNQVYPTAPHLNKIFLSHSLLISLEQLARKCTDNFNKVNVTRNKINDT